MTSTAETRRTQSRNFIYKTRTIDCYLNLDVFTGQYLFFLCALCVSAVIISVFI